MAAFEKSAQGARGPLRTTPDESGTPSMGGLIIYLAMLSASLFWARLTNRFVLLFW